MLGTLDFGEEKIPTEVKEEFEQPLVDLIEAYHGVTQRNALETYHDAQQALDMAMNLFSGGYLSLDQRAHAENLYFAICEKIYKLCQGMSDVPEDLQALEELGGLGRRPDVGLAHDLDEGHTAPVVVEAGLPAGVKEALVERLAGILFHVDAGNPDAAGLSVDDQIYRALQGQRSLVLGDLIALRKVRIEVVLAREDGLALDLTAQRERRLDREVDGLAVQHRQRARQPETHRARLRVGWRAERRRAPAEDLRAGQQVGVDLKPDDSFVLHGAAA